MAEYCPDLSARAVDERLKASLEALRVAEKNAVLWFAEVLQRKLYLELGYSSIQQYAELELGFKKARTSQFLRLSEALRELPELRESVARGDVSWTKAREVSGVATRKTESAWIAEARASTSRELERKVALTKERARAVRSGAGAQGELPAVEAGLAVASLGKPVAGATGGTGTENGVRQGHEPGEMPGAENGVRQDREPGEMPGAENGVRQDGDTPDGSRTAASLTALAEEVPCDLRHRLSPTQFARYEVLVEKLRKLGVKGSREELLLECLEIAIEVKAANQSAVRTAGRKSARHAGDPEEWASKEGLARRTKSTELDPGEFPPIDDVNPFRAQFSCERPFGLLIRDRWVQYRVLPVTYASSPLRLRRVVQRRRRSRGGDWLCRPWKRRRTPSWNPYRFRSMCWSRSTP